MTEGAVRNRAMVNIWSWVNIAMCPVFTICFFLGSKYVGNELRKYEKHLEMELDVVKASVNEDKAQIVHLHEVLSEQFNYTIQMINSSVSATQETMHEEVQKVNDDVSTENSLMAYQFAIIFTILGALISMWHMTSHIRHFNMPFVQRKILAMLWMVPIYSITSWLSLVAVPAEEYFGVIKDFYEAYCIYTFLSFLIAVLGRGDRDAVIEILARRADHLKPPLRLQGILTCGAYNERYDQHPRRKAEAVLYQCQRFAMQFVLLRPLTSVAMVVANATFPDGEVLDFKSPQFYIMLIENASVFLAFSGLLKFYHAVHEDLGWCRPFPKFLCIKGVVFMTFWQRMTISIIVDALYEFESDDEQRQFISQIQNFLICIEMFFFAVAHFLVFPTDEWEDGYRQRYERTVRQRTSSLDGIKQFGDNIALRDFVNDVKLVMRMRKRRHMKDRSMAVNTDAAPDGFASESSGTDTIDSSVPGGPHDLYLNDEPAPVSRNPFSPRQAVPTELDSFPNEVSPATEDQSGGEGGGDVEVSELDDDDDDEIRQNWDRIERYIERSANLDLEPKTGEPIV